MSKLYKQEGYDLIGAAWAVYEEMGSGYPEDVYQECLERELAIRAIPFESRPPLSVRYKGRKLRRIYRPDLVASGVVVAKLCASDELGLAEQAHLLSCLRATKREVGYLINFGAPDELEWKRLDLTAA